LPVIVMLVLAACGGEDAVGPDNERTIPTELELVAEASGTDAGKQIECSILAAFSLGGQVDRGDEGVVYHGTGGGTAARYFTPNVAGNATSFSADFYEPQLSVRLIGADSVEIVSATNEPVVERFWRELALFGGTARGADVAAGEVARGEWTCAPMDTTPDTGEYYDVTGSVRGTWVLREVPAA
jgi:hypothetical protein